MTAAARALVIEDDPTTSEEIARELRACGPDVAAAERRMFAANVEIGGARAAFFSSISLGGGWSGSTVPTS